VAGTHQRISAGSDSRQTGRLGAVLAGKIQVPESTEPHSSLTRQPVIGVKAMAEDRHNVLKRLFATQHGSLQSYFKRRIASKPEAADLAQEVYLRMLRTTNAETIRNPEAYLFAVAGNLVKEYGVLQRRHRQDVDIDDLSVQDQLAELPAMDAEVDADVRSDRLKDVLLQLTPKCRAAVIMQYQEGLTYKQIGERLHVSSHMVKKYLASALVLCRRRMSRFG
jgi:RNA polymerase sigma factor (sigma-70 family)